MAASPTGDFTETLPAKRMAAGVLFFNGNGEVLIVKPTYRDDWLIPGGSVDRDESPYQACIREVREELGIEAPVYQLLCMEYQAAHGTRTECLQFIFYGATLTPQQIEAFCLPEDELSKYRFCAPAEALRLLNPLLGKRLEFALAALQQNRTIYLENKAEIGAVLK